MVKGNWERRVELAAQRRAEAKERKAHKTRRRDAAASGELVCKRLSQMLASNKPGSLDDPRGVTVFLAIPEYDHFGSSQATRVCSAWLRGAPESSKCKRPHFVGQSLKGLVAVPPAPVPDDDESSQSTGAKVTEDAAAIAAANVSTLLEVAVESSSISKIEKGEWKRVRFAAVDGQLIYDASSPGLWRNWVVKRLAEEETAVEALIARALATSRDCKAIHRCWTKQKGLPDVLVIGILTNIFWDKLIPFGKDRPGRARRMLIDILHVVIDQVEEEKNRSEDLEHLCDAMTEVKVSEPEFCVIITQPRPVLERMFSFLETRDLCKVMESCTTLRDMVRRDETCQYRRRKDKAAVNAKALKLRSAEKKKKFKIAKTNKAKKKEVFGRGGSFTG